MAQTIYCDDPGCDKAASMMVTNLDNGNVNAFCQECFTAFIVATAVHLTGATEDMDQPAPKKTKKATAKKKPAKDTDEKAADA